MNVQHDYSGTSVFVVGGTSGINLGIAQAFAAAGARMGVASRKREKVDAACGAMAHDGVPPPLGYTVDVRDADAVAEALADFARRAGPIDVLISGAAGNFPAPAMEMSPRAFKAVIDIDLLGTYHVMRGAWPHLRKPGASVINISAPQAVVPMALQTHVCAAKAGVDMLTRSLALEWGPEGVRINGVMPGPIDGTEGMARLAPDEAARQAVIEGVPLRRMGTPDDVARACLFLGSQAASYVTGTIMGVDGGWASAGAVLDLRAAR